MLMIYKDIMTPIEILDNSNRLPVPVSSIYEPNLMISMIVHSNSTSEYSAFLDKYIEQLFSPFNQSSEILDSSVLQISESMTDPIAACQFHVIEVVLESHKYRDNEIQ